jgi:hypothetical protein
MVTPPNIFGHGTEDAVAVWPARSVPITVASDPAVTFMESEAADVTVNGAFWANVSEATQIVSMAVVRIILLQCDTNPLGFLL